MKQSQHQAGFTLIELLIAVGILVIITTLVYGSFARSFEAREFVVQAQERHQSARTALDRMAREISMAFVFDCRELDTPMGERRRPSAFKVERDGDLDRMLFTSFSHLRLQRDVHESDQNVLTYYGEDDPEQRGQKNLMRREKARIEGEFEEDGKAQILCRDVHALDVELWDDTKEEWVDDWDCTQVEQLNRLPRMVRITLTIVDEYKNEMPYTTVTRIFTHKPLSNWLKPSQ